MNVRKTGYNVRDIYCQEFQLYAEKKKGLGGYSLKCTFRTILKLVYDVPKVNHSISVLVLN